MQEIQILAATVLMFLTLTKCNFRDKYPQKKGHHMNNYYPANEEYYCNDMQHAGDEGCERL